MRVEHSEAPCGSTIPAEAQVQSPQEAEVFKQEERNTAFEKEGKVYFRDRAFLW